MKLKTITLTLILVSLLTSSLVYAGIPAGGPPITPITNYELLIISIAVTLGLISLVVYKLLKSTKTV